MCLFSGSGAQCAPHAQSARLHGSAGNFRLEFSPHGEPIPHESVDRWRTLCAATDAAEPLHGNLKTPQFCVFHFSFFVSVSCGVRRAINDRPYGVETAAPYRRENGGQIARAARRVRRGLNRGRLRAVPTFSAPCSLIPVSCCLLPVACCPILHLAFTSPTSPSGSAGACGVFRRSGRSGR